MTRPFEKLLFACRWLLTPFYLALIVALLALLVKAAERAYGLAIQVTTIGEEEVILGALGIVDLTLTASLIVLVVSSTYSNFVHRVDPAHHEGWPEWMAGIDFAELKLKLVASIVAISAIKMLEVFMNADRESAHDLAWQTGIFGGFVVAALVLGVTEAISRAYGDHGS